MNTVSVRDTTGARDCGPYAPGRSQMNPTKLMADPLRAAASVCSCDENHSTVTPASSHGLTRGVCPLVRRGLV